MAGVCVSGVHGLLANTHPRRTPNHNQRGCLRAWPFYPSESVSHYAELQHPLSKEAGRGFCCSYQIYYKGSACLRESIESRLESADPRRVYVARSLAHSLPLLF